MGKFEVFLEESSRCDPLGDAVRFATRAQPGEGGRFGTGSGDQPGVTSTRQQVTKLGSKFAQGANVWAK